MWIEYFRWSTELQRDTIAVESVQRAAIYRCQYRVTVGIIITD
jgi:hypothetical protein